MDRRTKRQKIQAMADQAVSPNEAEVAKKKLEDLPPDKPEVHPIYGAKIAGVDVNGHSITIIFTMGYDVS